MRDIPRLTAIGTAYLLALFAVDITTQLIDFFNITVPRHILNVPWSIGLAVLAAFVLWPTVRFRKISPLSWGGASMLVILIFWILSEIMRGIFGGRPNFLLIASCFPALLASQLARVHYQLFSDARLLIDAFVNTVLALSLLHLSLLFLMSVEMLPLFVNQDELISRNSISLMLAATVWLEGSRLNSTRHLFSARFSLLFGLTVLHIVSNGARAAGLIALAGVGLSLLCRFILTRYSRWLIFLLLSGTVIVAISFSYPIIQQLSGFHFLGQGDDRFSSLSRSASNWYLLRLLAEAPLFGVGADMVFSTKAGGYMSHTLYLLVLAAYGLLGISPVLIIGGMWLYNWQPEGRAGLSLVILLIVIMASFVNDPLIWYGLLLALGGVSSQGIETGRETGVQQS